MEPEKDQIGLTTKWFGLNLSGQNAASTLLFITVLALAGLTFWEHTRRTMEHNQITCQITLNLYMQSQPTDKAINWRAMPTDLYSCIPKWLYERDK